ncbi:MAG: PEGA domain-containing protein [Planctomycetota bacterium]|nr:MAG: PEGA domain-containing protein [Planctomycetota bacterium]
MSWPRLWTLCALIALAGCNTIRVVEIRTEPTGAEILVDDQTVGTSPVTYGFDFADPDAIYKVTARKEGYVPSRKRVSQLHLDAAAEERDGTEREFVLIKLDEDESWTRTLPSPCANQWVEIQVDPNLDKKQVWERLVDTVTKYYPDLSNLDSEGGYISAKPKEKRFSRGPTATVLVRNQFFCSMASPMPLAYKVKIESKINENGKWEPFDRVFQEDAPLLADLQAQLVAQE